MTRNHIRHVFLGEHGISLIEVLIVVGIVAILFCMTMLPFSTFITKYHIERQINTLHADLLRTRSDAMTKNRNHFVVIDVHSYSIVADTYPEPSGDKELDAADCIVRDRVLLRYPVNAPSIITFDNHGIVPLSEARTICVFSDFNPKTDCLVISRTRIQVGKIVHRDQSCSSGNCRTE